MRLFFSGEIDAAVDDDFREIRKAVEDGFNTAFAGRPLLKGQEEIGFIPIIVADAGRTERRYVNGPRQIIDYRLRIPFRAYRAAGTAVRIGMILDLLAVVLGELHERGIVAAEDLVAFGSWRSATWPAGKPAAAGRRRSR